MTIYLYVKTHKKTGLKYLGKTEQDPYTYRGSGVYWTNHIKKHGYDVETEILRECQTKEELKEWGLYYTDLWKVVESKDWANLKEECGDGLSSNDSRKLWSDSEHQSNISEISKKLWGNSEFRNKQYQSRDTQEYKKAQRDKANIRWRDENLRKKQSDKTTGNKHPKYDHTNYHFVHETDVKEYCTKYELYTKYKLRPEKISALILGNRKSHKGWRIIR